VGRTRVKLQHCHDLLQALIVWNALKTSRKVLGADMPLAADAQQFETRVEEEMTKGMQAIATHVEKEELETKASWVGYITSLYKQCQT
jgi:hypothetical protein